MNNKKLLYAITVEDVREISDELEIPFEENDLNFIEEKIGDFFASSWTDAIEYALNEFKNYKKFKII